MIIELSNELQTLRSEAHAPALQRIAELEEDNQRLRRNLLDTEESCVQLRRELIAIRQHFAATTGSPAPTSLTR